MGIQGNALRLAAVGALLAAGTTAQVARVCPNWCTHHEGGGCNTYIAGHQGMRMQVIYDGNHITTAKGIIVRLSFRRDTDNTKGYAATTITRTLLLAHTSKTPTQLSGTFANNLPAGAAKVYDGTLKLPAMPTYTGVGPAPFTVNFTLKTPFFYDRSKGNLFLEMQGGGPPNTYQEWRIDSHAHGYGNPNLTTPLGTPCSGALNQRLDLQVDGTNLASGGTLAGSFVSSIAKPTSLLLLLGASATQWGPVNLPFDLSGIGATGCHLRTSILVAMPIAAGASGFPAFKLPVPNLPALAMQEVFTQAIAPAPQANPAGLLTSQGWRCLVWPASRPATVSNCVMANSMTATNGSISRTPYGPVTSFFGTLP